MLTDSAIKSLQPNSSPYKVADEKGMHVLIRTNGKKTFQFRYRYEGKENTLSLGLYPDVSLKKARERRDEARKLLADGIDPSTHKKALKAAKIESSANSFEVIALEWLDKKCQDKSVNLH